MVKNAIMEGLMRQAKEKAKEKAKKKFGRWLEFRRTERCRSISANQSDIKNVNWCSR